MTPLKLQEEQAAFEAAGTRLHRWDKRDYEKNYRGEYTWTTQRQAFELWIEARQSATEPA